MSQFSLHHNSNPISKKSYPYLMDVQSSLLDNLETRLVIPLISQEKFSGLQIKGLNPSVAINSKEYILLTQQMAAIHVKNLGPQVSGSQMNRHEILSAIDFLITGF